MERISLSDNVLIPQHFGSLLYVRKTHEYLPYDRLTTQVLYSCMETSLSSLLPDLDKEITPAQKKAFLKLGRRLAFLDRKGRFLGTAVAGDPPADRLFGPLTLHLSITNSCDLKCRHCFAAPEMAQKQGNDLTDSELDCLFDQVAAMGCMRIALTGGEPLNRPDIFSIMDRITDRGIDVCLTTNGIRINRETAKELVKRPFAWINVSLEGASAKTNDAIRGEGTFDRVVTNLKKYFKHRVRFGLSITLNRLNIHEIPDFPRLARNVGAEVVMMRNVYPVGRGSEAENITLDFTEYMDAVSRVRQSGRNVHVVPTSCEPVASKDETAVIYENFGCAAGNTVASVYLNGDVSPCSLIDSGIELDSLRSMSFTDIWNRGRGFRRIRKFEVPDACRSCDVYVICSGGCRARAWEAFNDLGAPDPWCKKQDRITQRHKGQSE